MVRESNFAIGQTEGRLRGRQLSSGDIFSEAARYAYLGVLADGSVVFQWRDEGRVSRGRTQLHACSAGCLLKIVRHGNEVSAFLSASQGTWAKVSSHTFSTPLSRSVTVGMVATSDSPSTFPQYATYSSRFDHVRLQSSQPFAQFP